MKQIVGILILTVVFIQATAQSHTEKITRELDFEKKSPDNTLVVSNVNGSVTVEGYTGDKIQVEITKYISGKTPERLEQGKTEIGLGILDLADTLILYVDGLCGGFGKHENGIKNRHQSGRGWNYSWRDDCKDCNKGYDYKMDFMIKVPASLNLDVSTINDGDVFVHRVNGIVVANNINGAIRLQDLMRESTAATINGDVDVEYVRNPQRDCRFYSLNGDINAWFRKGLAASMSFESFNGDFFTNIEALEPLPIQVEKSSAGDGVKYKVNGSRYRIGTGGANLDFETFNGNVYLKERGN